MNPHPITPARVSPQHPVPPTLRRAFAWHRPLMTVAAAMAVLVVAGVAGMVADPRLVTGMPVWDKPTKFAISILIYAVTWALSLIHI